MGKRLLVYIVRTRQYICFKRLKEFPFMSHLYLNLFASLVHPDAIKIMYIHCDWPNTEEHGPAVKVCGQEGETRVLQKHQLHPPGGLPSPSRDSRLYQGRTLMSEWWKMFPLIFRYHMTSTDYFVHLCYCIPNIHFEIKLSKEVIVPSSVAKLLSLRQKRFVNKINKESTFIKIFYSS